MLIASTLEQVLSEDSKTNSKYIWRKHYTDGSPYSVALEDFETAGDYEDMVLQVERNQCENFKTN